MNERIENLIRESKISNVTFSKSFGSVCSVDEQNEIIQEFVENIINENLKVMQREWSELKNIDVSSEETMEDIRFRAGQSLEVCVLMDKIKKYFGVK